VFTAIPSKVDRKPKPKPDASDPNAGKQAVQLNAASQTPPGPILLIILTLYHHFF